MMLSESYKNRLLKLAGIKSSSLLTEIDNRDIIVNKIGLSQQIADWANNLSEKYSIWIANQIKINPRLYPAHESEFRYILDWKKANPNVKLQDFNFDAALKQAKVWHDETFKIQSGEKHPSSLENEDIFLKSGDMYWVKITNPEQCKREGGLMGHCMGDESIGHPQKIKSGKYLAYSLRDKENQPHITIEIDKKNGNIIEFKGKNNQPPVKQYIPYALDFLKQNKEWKKITDNTFIEMLKFDILILKQFINLFPNSFDKNYMLIWASINGRLEVVKYLIKKGADVHAENDDALRWASENGHLEVVKYLVEKGADVHAKNDYALIWASRNGHLEVVKYLKSIMNPVISEKYQKRLAELAGIISGHPIPEPVDKTSWIKDQENIDNYNKERANPIIKRGFARVSGIEDGTEEQEPEPIIVDKSFAAMSEAKNTTK